MLGPCDSQHKATDLFVSSFFTSFVLPVGISTQKQVIPAKKKMGSKQRKRRWRRQQKEAALQTGGLFHPFNPNTTDSTKSTIKSEAPDELEPSPADVDMLGEPLRTNGTQVNYLPEKKQDQMTTKIEKPDYSRKRNGRPLADRIVNQSTSSPHRLIKTQLDELPINDSTKAWLETIPSVSKKTWSTRTFFQLAYPR